MLRGRRFPAFYPGHFLLYIGIGLLLDSVLALFFALCDLLDILNASSRSLLNLNVLVILRFVCLYLLTFILLGLAITLFLSFIYFLYKQDRRIKRFLWAKADLLLLIWFLLLYPSVFGYYADKHFHVQLKNHGIAFLICGFIYLLVAVVFLYVDRRAVRYCLSAFRVLLPAAILPLFLHMIFTNIGFLQKSTMARTDATKAVDSRHLKNYNVLLITIDTCRADKLSCYGFGKQTSPNIDRLAEQGFIFDYAFSASNWTKPATASLFTSLYPGTHQTNTLVEKIPSSLLCLPEYFQEAGYHTAVFSANANVTPDFGFDRGVDFFYETMKWSMIHFSSLFVRLSRLSPYLEQKLAGYRLMRNGDDSEVRSDYILYERFDEWLEQIKGEKFFANLHFNAPHASYNPPSEYDVFADDPTVPVRREEPERRTRLPENQHRRILSLYYGEIFYVDDLIGKVIQSLKQAGVFDRTILVITADHGEEFFDHQSWGHAHTMFNELLHIPLIFHIPGHRGAPARIQNHVSIVDIGPTLLSLVGLRGGSRLDGKDLSPLCGGSPEDVHDFIFSESLTSPKDRISRYAVIGKDFKYIEYNYGPKKVGSFFNLNADFQEKNRLRIYQVPDHEALKEHLAVMKQQALSKQSGSEKIRLSREREEQLKALGYVQ